MTAVIVALIVLASTSVGACLGALWATRPQRLALREDRRRIELAARMTRTSADLAKHYGMSTADAERAITRAMTSHAFGAAPPRPWWKP